MTSSLLLSKSSRITQHKNIFCCSIYFVRVIIKIDHVLLFCISFLDMILSFSVRAAEDEVITVVEWGASTATCGIDLPNVTIVIEWVGNNTFMASDVQTATTSKIMFSPAEDTGSLTCLIYAPYNQTLRKRVIFKTNGESFS